MRFPNPTLLSGTLETMAEQPQGRRREAKAVPPAAASRRRAGRSAPVRIARLLPVLSTRRMRQT